MFGEKEEVSKPNISSATHEVKDTAKSADTEHKIEEKYESRQDNESQASSEIKEPEQHQSNEIVDNLSPLTQVAEEEQKTDEIEKLKSENAKLNQNVSDQEEIINEQKAEIYELRDKVSAEEELILKPLESEVNERDTFKVPEESDVSDTAEKYFGPETSEVDGAYDPNAELDGSENPVGDGENGFTSEFAKDNGNSDINNGQSVVGSNVNVSKSSEEYFSDVYNQDARGISGMEEFDEVSEAVKTDY